MNFDRISWLDCAIFVGYLLATLFIGTLFFKEQRTIKDYFLAGRSMNSFVVAISVLAALFSGITYLGSPAEVYTHGITLMFYFLSFFIATPITTLIFLPFFYQSRFYTAYQYLEERFSVQVRVLASSLFIIRVLLWLALATYAPALALESVTGLPLWFTILCTGILTTFYTTLGGMKAVIWTDFMQFFVLLGGQIIILWVAISHVPGGFGGVMDISREGGKLAMSFSFDLTVRATFWGVLLGSAVTNLVQLAADQVSVQRYLTATSLKEAKRSLWIKLALILPLMLVFSLTGLTLYAFYHIKGDPVASGQISSPDQILPYFVIHELPRGMPGLLIAAIFAATMSTISSGLNSLTSATLVDFYQRLWKKPDISDVFQLKIARYLTLGYGAIVILLALVVNKLGTLAEASTTAIGLVGGPMLGLFFLGMLFKRTNTQGAILGWIVGVVVLIPVCFTTKISFLWYSAIGCGATVIVGVIASLFFASPKPEQINDLVIENLEELGQAKL
jgi:SSS family transporter